MDEIGDDVRDGAEDIENDLDGNCLLYTSIQHFLQDFIAASLVGLRIINRVQGCRTLSNTPVSYTHLKYLVTTTAVLCSSSPKSTSNIGFPAVPEGSPSSLQRWISFRSPITYAKQLCVAFQYFLFIASINASASSSSAAGITGAINLDFFSTISPDVYKRQVRMWKDRVS